VVETNPASETAPGSVILNGNIVDNGGKVDEYGFIYWSADNAFRKTVIVGKANHTGFISKRINDLTPGTYYYKAYAKNTKGAAEGGEHSFTIVDYAIKVILNSELMNFDMPAFIEDDRTMVPFRAIFEGLGASVQWDDKTRTVTATRESLEIRLVIDGSAYINGEMAPLDVPAKIINNRTVVPLRFVSEALECNVTWDEINKTVVITQ
jgi:hypothetical protein